MHQCEERACVAAGEMQAFYVAMPAEVERTMRLAGEAFHEYRQQSPDAGADFLKRAADEIMNLGEALIERCSAETGLGVDRLVGERGWTPG